MEEMVTHRDQAIKFLKIAENMTPYIPDLDKREHMRSIIGSAAGALLMREPKAGIIAVGLSLIASLSIDMYDQYCEYRLVLAEAAYHQDMFYFYESMSRKVSRFEILNKGTQAFMLAMDCVILSGTLIYAAEGAHSSGKSRAVKKVSKLYMFFKDKFKKSNYKLTDQLAEEFYQEGLYFHQSLSQILTEVDDEIIKDKIKYNFSEMLTYLKASKNLVGGSLTIVIGG